MKEEKEEKDTVKDTAGCALTSLIGLAIFGGFSMFMIWLIMKIFGLEI